MINSGHGLCSFLLAFDYVHGHTALYTYAIIFLFMFIHVDLFSRASPEPNEPTSERLSTVLPALVYNNTNPYANNDAYTITMSGLGL